MDMNKVPRVYQEFHDTWHQRKEALLDAYTTGNYSFVPFLMPEQAVGLTTEETLMILGRRLGQAMDMALEHADTDSMVDGIPAPIQSPAADEPDGIWLKASNMVGINTRTIGSFWNIVKYVLTIPKVQDSIHLLPIWEPGVVGSLYGISSWQINSEFYSEELAQAQPKLDSVEKQLRAVVNLLHALGKTVGLDVIPHTDRFSEIALANPHYFEWLQREDMQIVDHSESLHVKTQDTIMDFLRTSGPACPTDSISLSSSDFFSQGFPEERRLRILFGAPQDREGRFRRRNQLVKYLNTYGLEPVPATMAPPFRGLRVDPNSKYVDSQGNTWYDFAITKPEAMSRVFNPLARYKLYGRLGDNANWEIDFDNPRREVWQYICEKYSAVQQRFGFDFMRGDMSHVQMRPEGVPEAVDDYYDILKAVKRYIQKDKGISHFGYFAETFLAPRNTMVYGDEVDHLEACDADTTLGDLQSTCVGSPKFLQRFRQYRDLLEARSFAPSFTVITGDKDDPRFDEFYHSGNELRLFMAIFLTDMPSYTALGLESRDVHYRPSPNEHYTKLFVFQEAIGPKATSGPYVWGKNGALFNTLTRLRIFADGVFPRIRGKPIQWLIHPDPTGEQKHIVWTQRDDEPEFVFLANTDTEHSVRNFKIPGMSSIPVDESLVCAFSTAQNVPEADLILSIRGKGFTVVHLGRGEGRVYRVGHRTSGGELPPSESPGQKEVIE
jgi:hypothetical protein